MRSRSSVKCQGRCQSVIDRLFPVGGTRIEADYCFLSPLRKSAFSCFVQIKPGGAQSAGQPFLSTAFSAPSGSPAWSVFLTTGWGPLIGKTGIWEIRVPVLTVRNRFDDLGWNTFFSYLENKSNNTCFFLTRFEEITWNKILLIPIRCPDCNSFTVATLDARGV